MKGVCQGRNMVSAVVVLVVLAVQEVKTFSYNTAARTVFSPGPNTNNHSYFGYSLVLRGGNRPLIVVGAPQETSNYRGHNLIKDPGVIYMCNIQPGVTNVICNQKILDTEGDAQHYLANGRSYHHRKENMWLGMTVAGTSMNNGTVVMCAPRWSNQVHKEFHLANGMCYALSQTDATQKPSEISQLIPLVDRYNQGFTIKQPEDNKDVSTYFYAYGQAGISLKLSEDGSEIIMGAPGIYVWTGSIVRYSVTKQQYGRDYFSKKSIPNPYYTPEVTDTSYFGYSVDSGKFISGRSNLYVAGAPRGADYKGQVLLFDFPIRENARYIIFAILEGHQLGEYFGSTIEAIDINRDGLSDLLVGAPLYAQKHSSDQGRVYVYMNHDKANMVEQQVTIGGSLQSGARFGSSIASIGDINNDGFNDVAIGAPYENNGDGAVYIYLGAANGLNPNYTQRISMNDMRGFGISISKAVDIDSNSCNDLAIGAYESAKAVLLRCHPSIDVVSTMEAFPSELSLESTNFTAKICFKFIGAVQFLAEIAVNLEVDREYNIAKLENPNDKTYNVMGKLGLIYCKESIILIDSNSTDFSRPIDVHMNFDLRKNPTVDTYFCEKCAVLRPSTKRDALLRVPFATGCGDDQICQPDLKLSVKPLIKSPYTIGSSPSIGLNIRIWNVGEPAFLTRIEFTPPSAIPLLRVPHRCHLVESLLTCDLANPLSTDSETFIVVELDASLLTSFHSLINFNITVSSGGEELTPGDNIYNLQIPLETEATILVIGEAANDGFVNINSSSTKPQNITISHTYEVVNEGPTSLDAFQIKYYIPVAYMDKATNMNYTLIDVFEPRDTLNQAPFLCNPENGNFYLGADEGHYVAIENDSDTTQMYQTTEASAESVAYTEGIPKKLSQDLFQFDIFDTNTEVDLPIIMTEGNFPKTKTLHLNCTDKHVTCFIVNCIKIGGLPAGGNGAHMVLRMKLNVTNLDNIIKKENAVMLSTYAVALRPTKVYSYTRSLVVGSVPPPPSTPIWIIILSVILGILLLTVITFGLYKCNFFRRSTKEDLELLKNQDNSINETIDDLTDEDL